MSAVRQPPKGYKNVTYVHPYKLKPNKFMPAPSLERELAHKERVKFFQIENARRQFDEMFGREEIEVTFNDPIFDAFLNANQAYTHGVEKLIDST